MAKLEQEIDRLFGLPLDEFTSTRNELARRLKKEGEKDAAEQVQALAKPSLPAWTINQLARQEKAALRALLDAGAKLRKAQERALRGGKSGGELRAAQREEREAVRGLTQRAERILEEAGRPAGPALLDRIAASLRAAATVTEPGRKALEAGRLSDELQASGFDALAGLDLPRRETAAPRDDLAERRQKKAETERARRELQNTARELADRAKAAERDAERAERGASEARQLAEESRRAADAAASELAAFDEGS